MGSRARIKQPRFPPTTWTVTELFPGESFTWVATGPGVRTCARHQVEPTGSGALVTLTLDQQGVVGRFVGRLTTGLTKRYLGMEANGLRERAERRPGG